MIGTRHGRRGYTLVEVMGYATILGVLLNVSTSVFLSTKRLHTLGSLALDRNAAIEEIERDFRKLAHGSARIDAAPAGAASLAGARALVGQTPSGVQYCLWRVDKTERLSLEKYESTTDGTVVLAWRKTYPPSVQVVSLRLSSGPGRNKLAQLDLAVKNAETPRTVPAANRFIALLGGT